MLLVVGRSSAAPVSSRAPKKKAFDRGGPVWPPRSNAADDCSVGGFAPQSKTGGSYFGLNVKEYPKIWFKNVKISKTFDVNLNRFKVVSGLSREHWIEKGWIFKEDPLGWFQWYCRYTNGRRIPHIDEIQIKRWKNFRRHVLAIEKNCEKGDLGCRKRQRQAILQWAYDPYR